MFQIKSEEEKDRIRGEFVNKRKVEIPQLLEEAVVNKLHQFLTRLLPPYWYCATCIRKDRKESPLLPAAAKENRARIAMAQKAFGENEFAYYFYRTFNAIPGQYSPLEYQIRSFFSSPECIAFLNEITGLELTQLNTLFVSKYTSGSFLSTHNDAGNGKLAFVIHLTKDWRPQYGGNLHFLDASREKIIETFTPTFNSMMIFEVPDEGIPHFVGHVAPNTPVARIALTGWFS